MQKLRSHLLNLHRTVRTTLLEKKTFNFSLGSSLFQSLLNDYTTIAVFLEAAAEDEDSRILLFKVILVQLLKLPVLCFNERVTSLLQLSCLASVLLATQHTDYIQIVHSHISQW